MDEKALLRGLDPDQRRAVTIDAAPLAIVAAAGSGKTTVLTRRIAHRIESGDADPRHVLALTFTREAAGELRRRLRRLDIREPIETGTFHAVSLRLLRDRALTTGTAPPVLAPDRVRLVREVLTETRIRCEPSAALADIDWARARRIAPTLFAGESRRLRRRPNLRAEQFAEVVERYEALKRRRGVVDFDDLLGRTLDTIERDNTFAEVVRWRFRHLFVDEAQDLNPLQQALLDAIRGGRSDLCLVGDPRQAIYGWNGADPDLLDDIEERLRGVTVVALTGNHRCSPQVVRAGAAALACVGVVDDTESRRSDGPVVSFVDADGEHDEAARVVGLARSAAQRWGPGQVAVLARTNEQLTLIGRQLTAAGLGVERAVGRSPLERAMIETGRCTSREQLTAWADAVWDADQSDPIRVRVADEIDRFLSSDERGGWRAWVEARQPFDDLEPEPGEGAVALVTFHAAKGREWRAVIVTGVETGLVPHGSASSPAQVAEEARLFYVALTRASDELVVTSAHRRRDLPVEPSPWRRALEAAAELDAPTPPPADLPTPQRPRDPLDELRAWRHGLARAAGVEDRAMCSDQTLRSMLDTPPTTVDEVAAVLGLGRPAAERVAPKLLSLLAAADPS